MLVIVSENWDEINATLAALGVKPDDAVVTTAAALRKGARRVASKKKAPPGQVSRADLIEYISGFYPVGLPFQDIADHYPKDQRGRINALLATMREYYECHEEEGTRGVYQNEYGYWRLSDPVKAED